MAGPKIELEIGTKFTGDSAFSQADRRLSDLRSGTDAALGNLSKLADQARTAFAALGVGLLVDRFVEWHQEIAKSIGDLQNQADAVGLGVEQLQAYQAAGRAAGSTTEQMQKVLATFNDALGRAAQGEAAAAKAFIALKVPILDANGNLRDHAELLTATAQALLGVESPGQRAALATALFGREGKLLTPVLREMAQGAGPLLEEGMQRGQIASAETARTFHDLAVQAEESKTRIGNLYAQLAAPIEAAGMGFVARSMQEISDSVALIDAHQDGLDKLMEFLHIVGVAAGGGVFGGRDAVTRAQSVLDQERRKAVDAETEIQRLQRQRQNAGPSTGSGWTASTGAALDAEIEAQRQILARANENAATAEQVINRFEDARKPAVQLPAVSVTGSRFAQPTGAGERDRIGEEISKLQNEAKAAKQAMGVLENANPATQLMKDVEQAAEFEKKVGDLLANSGKYNPNDPRIQQLRDAAAAAVAAQQAEARLKETLELAYQTNAKFGDGKAQLAKTQAELDDALQRGWITQGAYNNAMVEATLLQQEQILKAQQYKEGLDGIAAGLQYAMLQQQKQNTAFNQGVQLYNEGRTAFSGFFSTFNNDLRQGKGVWDAFADAGTNALDRIGDKLMQMATDQLWTAAFGGSGGGGVGGGSALGGIGSWLGGLFGGGGGASAVSFGGVGAFGFAGGGDYPANRPRIVGEKGWELDVPKSPGTVLNQKQLASMLGAGSGGTLTIVLDSDLLHATMDGRIAGAEPRIVKKAASLAPAAVAAAHAQGGGEWRLGRS